MDQTLAQLTRSYVGQAASSIGFWLSQDSVEIISSAVMNTASQGIIKRVREAAEKGVIANPQTQI